jgi:hypothetical protein
MGEMVGMELVTPMWFKQRQGKAEAAGENTYRLTGPNLREAFISIRQGAGGMWAAALRHAADGPEVAATEQEIETEYEAWEAAFEIYRNHVVI